jgi:hypothetical protein
MNLRFASKCLAVVILLMVAGCGLFRFEQRAPWRDQAERECLSAGVVKITSFVEPAKEIDGPGSCGMLKPFRISALAEGSVGLKSRALLACPMVNGLDHWIIEVVQPAARLYLGSELAEVNIGSYSCRNVNNQWSGNKSEHSYGNAVDVMSFKFEDGRVMTVEKGWRGAAADQNFLREVFVGACRMFSTVLAPGSDMFHYNHLHLDLGRHSGGRQICKPIIKFEPRVTPAMIRAPMSIKTPQKRIIQEEEDNSGEFGEEPISSNGIPANGKSGTVSMSSGVQSSPLAPVASGPLPQQANRSQPNTSGPLPLGTLPSGSLPQGSTPVQNVPMPPARPPRLGGLY